MCFQFVLSESWRFINLSVTVRKGQINLIWCIGHICLNWERGLKVDFWGDVEIRT